MKSSARNGPCWFCLPCRGQACGSHGRFEGAGEPVRMSQARVEVTEAAEEPRPARGARASETEVPRERVTMTSDERRTELPTTWNGGRS